MQQQNAACRPSRAVTCLPLLALGRSSSLPLLQAPADEEKLEKGWPPSNSSSALVSRAGSAEAPAPPLPAGPKPVKSTPTCAACSRGVVGATAHIVTAVVGSGVLALPYSTAVLGW